MTELLEWCENKLAQGRMIEPHTIRDVIKEAKKMDWQDVAKVLPEAPRGDEIYEFSEPVEVIVRRPEVLGVLWRYFITVAQMGRDAETGRVWWNDLQDDEKRLPCVEHWRPIVLPPASTC